MNPYEQRQEAKRERLHAAAARHQSEGQARFNEGSEFFRELNGQPILIGHHSEKSDRNRRAKMDAKMRSGVAQMQHADELDARADAIGTGGISQDDPDAVSKLRRELADKEAAHARMVAANRIAKSKSKTEPQKLAELAAMGFSERDAMNLLHPTSDYARRMGFVGFEAWELSNSNANIRRIRERIAHLERMAGTDRRPDIIGEGWRIEDDPDENRIILTLDARGSRETFAWLRSMGWRWSRTRSAFLQFRDHYGRWASEWSIGHLNERVAG